MRLSPPTFIVFVVSCVLAALSVLPVLGVITVDLPISGYWLLVAAWAVLASGTLLKGL